MTNSTTLSDESKPTSPVVSMNGRNEQVQEAQAVREQALRLAAKDFDDHIHIVFAESFIEFVSGEYVHRVADHIQNNAWTIDMSGRDHFKSTRLYARIQQILIEYREVGCEGHYFSYKLSMAGYHLAKVKEMIRGNPMFNGIIDNKPQSDNIIDYQWPGGKRMTFTPQGLMSFKRGIHADFIFVDDPFQDPEQIDKLSPLAILKINRIIVTELDPFVNKKTRLGKKGEFRIVGTPQTWHDFFFADEHEGFRQDFALMYTPAIIDEKKRIALWPEWWSYDELEAKRRRQPKTFEQEYLCRPAYDMHSYLDRKELLECVDDALTDYDPKEYQLELKPFEIVAGWDTAKKVHPGHFTVDKIWYEQVENEETGKMESALFTEQIHEKWFDQWDYSDQIEYIDTAIDNFGIARVGADNTNGVLEGYKESGRLSDRYELISMTTKIRNAGAAQLQTLVTKKAHDGERRRMKLLGGSDEDGKLLHDRQFNQLLNVTDDLRSMETPEGHGDSFWSRVCMLKQAGKATGTFAKSEETTQISEREQARRRRRGVDDAGGSTITGGMLDEGF